MGFLGRRCLPVGNSHLCLEGAQPAPQLVCDDSPCPRHKFLFSAWGEAGGEALSLRKQLHLGNHESRFWLCFS